MFYIGLYRENVEKKHRSETTGPRALKLFGIKISITQVDLYQVCSNIMPLGSKIILCWDYMFYIGLYRDNKKKSSLKPQSLEP